jgi:murein DD-endopeptidase MepM/ murein hydrolase activator NlpD
MKSISLNTVLQNHQAAFRRVVPFDAARDRLLQLDFTAANTALTDDILADTDLFSEHIRQQLGSKYRYGIGGYAEHRTIYSRSRRFDEVEEPRRLHLGMDVWGPVNTPIFAPLDGTIHSFCFNNHFGDYGATIILHHVIDDIPFYTLYGHLSVKDINGVKEGDFIRSGTEFAHFGQPKENGYWPPHLHFQIIGNMQGKKGDYRGVCKYSEREKYLLNCPDPDLILQMMKYAGSF